MDEDLHREEEEDRPQGHAYVRQVEDGEVGDEGEGGAEVQVVHHPPPAQAVHPVPQGPRRQEGEGEGGEGGDPEQDALYDEAVKIVVNERKPSISYVQRRLKIGYNRAARLIEEMEAQGVVSPPEHNGNRTVLAPPPPRD